MDDNSYRMGRKGEKYLLPRGKEGQRRKLSANVSLSLWKYKFRSGTDTR